MKKNDNGLGELLALLKNHPELMRELVFDPSSVARLLKSRAARRLVIGEKATAFLEYVSGYEDGYPIAQCYRQTKYLCAKGTKQVLCGSGTQPTKPW
jgi:hypothetical protein